jgi:inosose dehydratase
VLNKYVDRIGHVHLKDMRPALWKKAKKNHWSFLDSVKAGVFTVPGDGGGVDFPAVFKKLKKAKYEGWMVVEAEQDPAKANPMEYAWKARQYIKENMGI